jgi:hypothetical protein
MDVNKIFDLFGDKYDEGDKKTINNVLIDFTRLPEYNARMFIKSFLNSEVLEKKMDKLLKNTNIDELDIAEISNKLVYNMAWKYISELDLDQEYDIMIIKNIKEKEFDIGLNNSMKYFERMEEYEKCAFICKIKNLRED